MANGWTPDRQARQAILIRAWKPWEGSTGPTTDDGKARSARNGFRGGHRRAMRDLTKEMNGLLQQHRDQLSKFTG